METVTRALRPGTVVHERYEIEKVLGEGGFGVTYQAWDAKEQCVVAMKEYMPLEAAARYPGQVRVRAKTGYEEDYIRFRERFLEEAKVIYKYREHPNIARVQHLFNENNTAYYVMEFMEGRDLDQLLKNHWKRLSWDGLKPIVSQIAEALRTVHKSGIIHCDISPDNVFVLNGGQIKLIDFGAARSVMKGPSSVLILKKGFAPPEQFSSGGRLGPWTDIYALGVTIYYAFTGIMPPISPERLAADKIVWPSQMGFSVPSAQWERALQKAMALRPEERYQDIEHFWKDLTEDSRRNAVLALQGIQGYFSNITLFPKGEILIGTDASRCRLVYLSGEPGISGVHMRFWSDGRKSMLMDMGSSYGTFLNGKQMTPGLVYELYAGDMIELGAGQIFRAVYRE